MRWFGRLIMASILCAGVAHAQPIADETRARNLSAALEAAAAGGGGQEEARARLDAWLATIPRNEAIQTELDLVESAVEAGHLRRDSVRFAREHLRIVERYMELGDPDRDAVFDYWSYRVMVEAKHERKEIAVEERDYLLGRKQTELRRSLDANAAQREADRVAAQRRIDSLRQADQARAEAQEAEARAFELERTRLMIESFQRGVRSTMPGPAVTCTRIGIQTICR